MADGFDWSKAAEPAEEAFDWGNADKPAMSTGAHPMPIKANVQEPTAEQARAFGVESYPEGETPQTQVADLPAFDWGSAAQPLETTGQLPAQLPAAAPVQSEDEATLARMTAEATAAQAAPQSTEPSFMERAKSYIGRRVEDISKMPAQWSKYITDPALYPERKYGEPRGMFDAVDTAKAALVDPLVSAGQEAVRRAQEASFAREPEGPVTELLKRTALQLFAGTAILEDMDEKRKLAAVNDTIDIFNSPVVKYLTSSKSLEGAAQLPGIGKYVPDTAEKKAAMLLGTVEQVGQLLLWLGGGKALSIVNGRSVILSSVVNRGVTTALQQALTSLGQPGVKPTEAATQGLAVGAGIGAVAGVIKLGSRPPQTKPKVVGVATGDWAGEVADDISKMKVVKGEVVSRGGKTPTPKLLPETTGPVATAAKISDPKFKPGFSTVDVDPATGQLRGNLVQRPINGATIIHSVPLNHTGDAVAFKELLKKKNVNSVSFEPSTFNHPTMTQGQSGAGFIYALTLDENYDPFKDYFGPTPESPVSAPSKPGTVNERAPQSPAFDLDRLPPDLRNKPVVVSATPDGVRLDQIPDTKLSKTKAHVEDDWRKIGLEFGNVSDKLATHEISTPETPIRDLQDTKVRDFGDIAKIGVPIGGGSGPPGDPFVPPPPKPPAAPVPQAGELTDAELGTAKTLQAMAVQAAKNPSLYDRTMRQLVGSHLRGPKDLAQLAAMQKGAKALEQSGIDIINNIQKTFGKGLTANFERDLLKLAKAPTPQELAKVSADISNKPYGALFNQHKEKIYDLLRERDANNALLEELGVTKEGETLLREKGEVDAYVARSFLAYLLPPKKWAEIAVKDQALMAEGINWLRKENGYTDNSHDSDLAVQLFDIISSGDPINAIQNPKYGIKSAQHLKVRKDLPPVLLKLLGEVESGSVALGISLGTQRALLSNAMVWKEIASRPDWAVPTTGNDPALVGWQKLPNNKRWYGAASGMYVSPEIYDTMVTLPNTIENSKFLAQSLIGFVKSMEVAGGGAGPWINNTMGNVFGSIKSGGLDPLGSPLKAGKSIGMAAKAMVAYNKNPTSFGAPDTVFAGLPTNSAQIVMDAKSYGVDVGGFHGTEVNPIQKRLADSLLEQQALMDPNSDYFSRQNKLQSGVIKFLSVHKSPVMAALGRTFDQNDRIFKIANWVGLVNKYMTAPEKYLKLPEGTPQHQVREAAKRQAASVVNRSFQQPALLGPGVDRLRKSGVPIIAKYFTSFAEDLRVMGDIPGHIKDDPEVAWRLFKYSVAMGALFGGAGVARRLSGIPDEEVDAVLMQQNPSIRKGPDFMQMALPWRDAKGRAQVWDMSSYLPITKFLNGTRDEPMFQRVLTNAFTLPIEGGGASGIAGQTLSAFGAQGLEGGANAFVSSVRPGEAGVLNGLNHVWDKLDLMPQAITKQYDILRKGEVIGTMPRDSEVMTTGQMIGATFGGKAKGLTLGATPTLLSMLGEFRKLKNSLVRIADKPDDIAMKMLPQIAQTMALDPRTQKDVKMQATIAKMMQLAQAIQAQTAANAKAEAAKQAPTQILPEWAR